MATPVGAILCVGMLGLATVILVAMTLASLFVVIPIDERETTRKSSDGLDASRIGRRHYTTAV
jgi:hypothetical protein